MAWPVHSHFQNSRRESHLEKVRNSTEHRAQSTGGRGHGSYDAIVKRGRGGDGEKRRWGDGRLRDLRDGGI